MKLEFVLLQAEMMVLQPNRLIVMIEIDENREIFRVLSLGHNRNSKRKHIFSLDTYPVRASSTSFHFLFISIFDEKLDRTRKAEKL